jgi:hypothetical protein
MGLKARLPQAFDLGGIALARFPPAIGQHTCCERVRARYWELFLDRGALGVDWLFLNSR